MVRISKIKENPRCVASITVRAKKRVKKGSTMRIDNKQHKILGIIHTPIERLNDK